LNVAELSAAKITIKQQQLLPSLFVATLHKALKCFTEHTLKPPENEALLYYATLKCGRALTHCIGNGPVYSKTLN